MLNAVQIDSYIDVSITNCCFVFNTNTVFTLTYCECNSLFLSLSPFILSLSFFIQHPSTPSPFVPCSWSAGQMGWEKANNPPTSHMLFIHNITRCNALTPSFMFYKLFINSQSPAAQIYGAVVSLYMFSVN